MKISASVYAGDENNLPNLVQKLDQLSVDYLHVDCNNDFQIYQDIPVIKANSPLPIDLHIISSEPQKHLNFIEKSSPEFVCFQYELLPSEFTFPKSDTVRWGLAISTDTSIDVFEKYEQDCDFILIMATVPGQSGGRFNSLNFKKIRDFKHRFPEKRIHVDGGVNDQVSFILRSYGVNLAVVGSYLLRSEQQLKALHLLRHENVESEYKVEDMMVLKSRLPVLNSENVSVSDILLANEKYSLGYVLFENQNGEFAGISTNADIRRALIRNLADFNAITAKDVINPNCYRIGQNATINEMFRFLGSIKQNISYLPVVNSQNQLTGALNFNFLIKGEL